MSWISATEALALLGVRQQTLYANVSRGRIRAKPDPKDPRRSLYDREDVRKLAARRPGPRSAAAVAEAAIGWGVPVLASAISTVADGRLWYRGRDAVALSDDNTAEQVSALLWNVPHIELGAPTGAAGHSQPGGTPFEAALIVLARRAAADPPSRGRSAKVLVKEGAGLVNEVVTAMLGPTRIPPTTLHSRMADAWRAPAAEDVLRRALVVLSDHELNASTFAARVAASTGAPIAAGLLAGLATLAGPLHGGAAAEVGLLASIANRYGAAEAVGNWLAQGRSLPAFGHPLYPDGDPRAAALFQHFTPRPAFAELRQAAEDVTGERVNVDFALSAIGDAFDLPADAPFMIFAIARSVGWVAHILEQVGSGNLIRPRARYTGPSLDVSIPARPTGRS